MIELRFSDLSSLSRASWLHATPIITDDYIIYRMGLFSFLRKNKQESASNEGEFSSRAEEESKAVRNRGKRKAAGSAPVDPVLPEKKRARRRLVGAVALVLAVIIGLPMVLDSEPKPLADDIAIQIPSKDKTAANRAASSSSSASSRVAASASLDKKEEVVEMPNPASTTIPTATPAVKPGDQAKPESAKPVVAPNPPTVAKVDGKPEIKTETKPDPKPAVKPEKPDPKVAMITPEKKPDDAARAMAILEDKPEAKPEAKPATDKKVDKIIVQVAALATQEKVNELQAKLKEAGIKSYTQKVATESGERIRIRIGPLGSKDEADKLQAKLVKLGLNGKLVPTEH